VKLLRERLRKVARSRATQNRARHRAKVSTAALVGYTNAGKSTILRRLTDAGVLIEDKLFSTLDPTTRRLDLPRGSSVLLTDTVGFVRKLPHGLIEAFRSTLEEVVEAALLLHVVDASRHPERQIAAVDDVLKELGASQKPTVLVLNKTDLLDEVELDKLVGRFPDAVTMSAAKGEGLDDLLEALTGALSRLRVEVELLIPFDHGDLVARLHDDGEVLEESYEAEGTRIVARMDRNQLGDFSEYVTKES
jgi:GTP-binding protein HflX